MKNKIGYIAVVFLFLTGQTTYGQETNREKASSKGKEAIQLMDDGKVDESILLLKEAQNLDPHSITYPYELGYAYYLKKDYKKTIKYLESIKSEKITNDRVYQLLGNAYDMLGESDKAVGTYESGLKIFPKSGHLYLEMGAIQRVKGNLEDALGYYEKGIEVDPEFSSNYYWASKIFCISDEKVSGMIYGEIFMNLERNTKRTAEISELLYDQYKTQIKLKSDTALSVSFSKNAFVNAKTADSSQIKLPFGVGVYETTLAMSILGSKSIDINTLDPIRTNFINNYFSCKHNKIFPNVLFSYQKKIIDLGYGESYNHWILMKGDEDAFEKWLENNEEKWTLFSNWFLKNPLKIDSTNNFFRKQYD